MSNDCASPDHIAPTVFSASLTLMAILIAVIGVFVAQIGELEQKGLDYLASSQKHLLNGATVYFVICSWSAFFSFLTALGAGVNRWVYLVPTGFGIFAIGAGVPVWVWIF